MFKDCGDDTAGTWHTHRSDGADFWPKDDDLQGLL